MGYGAGQRDDALHLLFLGEISGVEKHRIGGLNHFGLLDHPLIYGRILGWLQQRPEGPRPAAPDVPAEA